MQEAVGLLDSIAEFCRRANMAESTFGRRAVNDGKFVSRLRDGARITPETLERVSVFLTTLGVAAPTSPRSAHVAARSNPTGRDAASGRTRTDSTRLTRNVRTPAGRADPATRYHVPALSTRPSGSSRRRTTRSRRRSRMSTR